MILNHHKFKITLKNENELNNNILFNFINLF